MTRYVIRKGGLADRYLQPDDSWGSYKTARRFRNQTQADEAGKTKCPKLNYGIFPTSLPKENT